MAFAEYDVETQRALRLFVALARCADSVSDHARADIHRNQLKTSEFAVLELLYHKGPTPLSQVAEKVLLTNASITHVVDQLEKRELVQRIACPEDRRVSYAELTPLGREKIASLFPEHARRLVEAVSGLSPEEQEQAITLLKKLGQTAKLSLAHNEA